MQKHERARVLRKKHLNLSQEEFGESMGRSQNWTSLIERGELWFTQDQLDKLQRVHNINIVWLESGEGEPFLKTDENQFSDSIDVITSATGKGTEKQVIEKIVPVVIDREEKEYITYIPESVYAGFAREYPNNTQFMRELVHFHIPGHTRGDSVAFTVEGNSMAPTLPPGALVVGSPVGKLDWIHPKDIHIVVAHSGNWIKRFIYHKSEPEPFLEWICDNEYYNELPLHQRKIPVNEVLQVFRYEGHFSDVAPAPDGVVKLMQRILAEVLEMKKKINAA